MNNNQILYADLLNESSGTLDNLNVSNLTADTATITNLTNTNLTNTNLSVSSSATLPTTTMNGQLNITGLINQNDSSNGWVLGNVGGNAPSGYSGICHKALANDFNNSALVQNSGGDVTFNA